MEELGVLQHHFFLAAVGHLLCSFIHFGGGLSFFEGQGSRSQEGCDVFVI